MKYIIICFLFLISISAFGRTMNYSTCDIGSIQFDDGDTFSCNCENIRVLGIDTPEIKHEAHGIFTDQPYGRDAAKFTERLIKKAERVMILRSGRDRYNRTLAHVILDGELLAVKLIKEGLAYESISEYGDNGFKEIALLITEAAKTSPQPKFIRPSQWRKKNQRR